MPLKQQTSPRHGEAVKANREVVIEYNGTKASWELSKDVTIVEVKGCVKEIRDCAFKKCQRLKALKLCCSLKRIGISSCADCVLLEKITINPKCQIIDLMAFEGYLGVTELIIPQGVLKVIQSQAFPSCRKIKRVEIPENVTSIGAMVSMSCIQLNEAILPQGIKGISDGLFMLQQIRKGNHPVICSNNR
jgi:hypothetical protein